VLDEASDGILMFFELPRSSTELLPEQQGSVGDACTCCLKQITRSDRHRRALEAGLTKTIHLVAHDCVFLPIAVKAGNQGVSI
jgi:hypothetical protein